MATEPTAWSVADEFRKLLTAHVYEKLVVACLEPNLRLLGEVLVHHRLDPLGCADWRNCADLAVLEQLPELVLSREPEIAFELPVEFAKLNTMTRWHYD